jgi:UDP:flavonoid glycosyltransferase YjiC (YdhE family)
MEMLKRSPLWLRRVVFRLSRWQADRLLARPINRLRSEWGLTNPVRGILHAWGNSPGLVLGLFPDWYAPKRPDWPPQTVLTRFPLYDETAERPIPPEVEAFLAAGSAPILLTPGSLNAHAREFFEAGLAACAQLSRRAMLVTPFREQLPPQRPATAAHFDFLPFSRAFPRCAAVVHHGGIGTGAQAMAAGIPQLIMAMAHDQPDNAWRLRHLGVADYLYPGQFRPDAVADRLAKLLASDQVAAACRQTRARMADQMPASEVAEILERYASRTTAGTMTGDQKVMEKPG